MKKPRVDEELVAQGFFASQEDAKRAVMAGQVSTDSRRIESPGERVTPGIFLHVKGQMSYVSRGGLKLEGALDTFGVSPEGLACLDVGCSTGGFTDCLLKRGAASVVSVDVGYAQFAWSLRNNEKVELLERTNMCDLEVPSRQNTIDLAVCDVSFTSVLTILPAVISMLRNGGRFITLAKPQFEVERDQVSKGGIVTDAAARLEALEKVANGFCEAGLLCEAACVSPIHGAKGNIEYLLMGKLCGGVPAMTLDFARVVMDEKSVFNTASDR